ncbi:MAG: sugar ABC transporter ATP-binding protein [Gammaproteobacteria bacterium]|nr:sugar ABC transporter ATP-binding protein [Gammaproteobacteria bacterium]MCY4209726.1 sugar ABC transporter ATP-binding protein [Gammaproteobacteria bacterium]MCY4338188.1 sugar ABC transporter ATP-binding protein [Gammaproteobacteria bacterium]
MPPARLSISDLHKSFATPVLCGVNMTVKPGEVHGLIGENGAGKSTLMNILCGLLPWDQGKLFLDGASYTPGNAGDALRRGITLAAQELSLIDTLSVAENIFLRRLPARHAVIRYPELLHRAGQLMQRVGMEIADPGTPVSRISLAQRQLTELAKALAFDSRLLILDEPTAALTEPQAQRLHRIIRELAAGGAAVIYISHRLKDVVDVSDTISVLRDGQVVNSAPAGTLTPAAMIRLMSGRASKADTAARGSTVNRGGITLEIDGLASRQLPHPISFCCFAGEIIGIAGLAGSGQAELLQTIFKLHPATRGTVTRRLGAARIRLHSPRQAIELGLGFLPEDRKQQGIFAGQSIRLNLTLPGLQKHAGRCGVIRSSHEHLATEQQLDQLSVKRVDADQHIELLSGGNQQKVLVSRWLHQGADIFLLNEPTRGVDVPTKHFLHDLFRKLAARGRTLVIVSSEIEELMTLCHRILVLSNRKPVKMFNRDAWDYNAILAAAFSEYSAERRH